MSLLDRIFKRLNREKNTSSPSGPPENSTFKNLIFDWYNDGGIEIADFRKELFDPCIAVLKNGSRLKYLFESAEEQTIDRLFENFSMVYLAAKYPNLEYLEHLMNLITQRGGPHYGVMDFIRSNANSRSFTNQPAIANILELGSGILKSFHAIHSRKNQNISYMATVYQLLGRFKYEEQDDVFFPLFNFINEQAFKEKPFVLLIASIQRNWLKRDALEPQENPKQDAIEKAFAKAVEDYNNTTDYPLDKKILIDFAKAVLCAPASPIYQEIDYKKRRFLGIKSFPEVQEFIDQYKDQREALLQNIIYILDQYYISTDNQKLYKDVFKAICSKYAFDKNWADHIFKYPLNSGELIVQHAYFPIIQSLEAEIDSNTPLVKSFERLSEKYIKSKNRTKIEAFLQELYKKLPETDDKVFINNQFTGMKVNCDFSRGQCYFHINSNKDALQVFHQFIGLLAPIASVSVKSLVNNFFYYNYEQVGVFTINGKDYPINRNVIYGVNLILKELELGYRMIPIPHQKARKDKLYASSLMVMNATEFENFKSTYLSIQYPDILDKHFIQSIEYKVTDAVSIRTLEAERKSEISNPFVADHSWNWFREKYIEPKNNKEAWYDIMAILIATEGSKSPNKKWLKKAKDAIIAFGPERFFKELGAIMGDSVKESTWLVEAYRPALKGIIWSCTAFANEDGFAIVKSIVEMAYTKIRGIGPKSAAVGNLGMDALAKTGEMGAFGMLNLMRNKSKYSRFVKAIDKYIDKFKESSDLPEEAIADRAIPRFGFHESEKILKVSDQISAVFRFNKGKLTKKWIVNEKEMSKAPKELLAAFPNEEKEINAEFKRINTIFKDLRHRIRSYWLLDRKWTYEDWKAFIYEHPLIHPLIQGMIWQNESQETNFIIQEDALLQVDAKIHKAKEEDIISLWHPIVDSEENIQAWQDYILQTKLVQPFRQVFREHYPFSATEIQMEKSPRFAHHFMLVNKLMAIANGAGWRFTYEHEGQSWPRRYLKTMDLTVHLQCDYDRSDFAIPSKDLYFTKGNTTKITYTSVSAFEVIPFSEVPLKTLSELCRDIDLFIATSSIANDPELSIRSENYQHYRDDFHRGKFSDNASAKVRKRILTQLIPILKLVGAQFEGNYLVVSGKLNDYRINLGSGFAQIKGSQKHINLLPDIAPMKKNRKIHVPIQDDETLYIILAKALFLQKDDQVTDEKLLAVLKGV